MNTHKSLRKEIDRIDEELVKLFEERMNISVEVANYKIANNIPVFDEMREKEVIEKNVARISDSKLKEYGEQFFNHLMGLSRHRQQELINEERLSKD
ncbi:chorismate mutase [Corticicoccus populi]|uniref:Chorismate mutase n=1 Tax=Corticicoccus populi TaxID=1812821 RepID=A0ABW5WXR7_9STAP